VCEYKTFYVCVIVACLHETTTPSSFSKQALDRNACCVRPSISESWNDGKAIRGKVCR